MENSPQQIWQKALTELRMQVNGANFKTWLEKTSGFSYKDDLFIIGVGNTFVAEYLSKNQLSLIEKVLSVVVGREVRIDFRVDEKESRFLSTQSRGKKIPAQQSSLPLFNPKYTFDSFIVGGSNQLAYAAARMVAEDPGHNYNPLFIYGGHGNGKTHLLQAIGNMALTNTSLKVLYVSAEQFTNELVSSIRESKTDEFRNRYRQANMLLIDDIQFFSGKQQTEESFFHTFNELHNTNQQIAVTSDCPPKSMPFLQERLRSRFEGGLVTDIQMPDFETRLTILKAKAQQEGANLSQEVLEYIAFQIQQNIRALEGALNRVIAYSKLIKNPITSELAAKALKDIVEKPKALNSPNIILEAVVNSFQITPADLKSSKRNETTVLARQIAMYLLRQETDYSLAEVGKELGDRSPATVSHAYQKIANAMNNDPPLRRKVLDIQQQIHGAPIDISSNGQVSPAS
ncbi:MAG: chromosomal replication initiator protein DnaA [Chloroflexota bacterium]